MIFVIHDNYNKDEKWRNILTRPIRCTLGSYLLIMDLMKHIVSDNDSSNNFKSCSDNKNDDEIDYNFLLLKEIELVLFSHDIRISSSDFFIINLFLTIIMKNIGRRGKWFTWLILKTLYKCNWWRGIHLISTKKLLFESQVWWFQSI